MSRNEMFEARKDFERLKSRVLHIEDEDKRIEALEHLKMKKELVGLEEEPSYRADARYLEEATYLVMVEMLERLPQLKPRIKKYVEAFP